MLRFPKCNKRFNPYILVVLITVLWISDSRAQTSSDTVWPETWQGKLNVAANMQLTLVLNLQQQGDSLSATLDSPDQGAMGIPASQVSREHNDLRVEFAAIGAIYEATRQAQQLSGTFTQAGRQFPLVLNVMSEQQKNVLAASQLRPQEPQAPYPYIEEKVNYAHPSGEFDFAATLTKPTGKGPFAAAILISGSGPQDRDETLAGHKPFKLLADTLSRKGFAVLRFDDRGTAESGGSFAGTTIDEFASDVQAAFDYLQSRSDIKPAQIGLIGHSEGGVTGPIFAAHQAKVAFVVMLAGLGVPGNQLWATQQRDMGLASGMDNGDLIYQVHYNAATLAAEGASLDEVKAVFSAVPGANQQMIDSVAGMLSSPWGRSLMAYQPQTVLSQLGMPLLAINGDLDLQVAARENLDGIRQIMANTANQDVTVLSLPELNHLFQQAKTGLPLEYAQISETINPAALTLISDWLQARF